MDKIDMLIHWHAVGTMPLHVTPAPVTYRQIVLVDVDRAILATTSGPCR